VENTQNVIDAMVDGCDIQEPVQMQVCEGPCGRALHPSKFTLVAKGSTKRRKKCKDCRNAEDRERARRKRLEAEASNGQQDAFKQVNEARVELEGKVKVIKNRDLFCEEVQCRRWLILNDKGVMKCYNKEEVREKCWNNCYHSAAEFHRWMIEILDKSK